MMDWTDRHCRFFHRLLTRRALIYTEMITTGALLHGDRARLLHQDPAEHPVALQLGGSDPVALARCARMGAEAGYDEINLNVGCPSDRVQEGRFGACLMAEPALVGDCVAAMKAAVAIPVTVKCRLGIDDQDPETALDALTASVMAAGVDALIVHARKAWLEGLSPKENREVPPLDYARVFRLKRAHPNLPIILNGGIDDLRRGLELLAEVDGLMMGRTAYRDPWRLLEVHERSAAFRPEAFDQVKGRSDLWSPWLEHLLLLSMLQHPGGAWTWGRYVTVHAADNVEMADRSVRYGGLLADATTFRSTTLEEVLATGALPSSAARARSEAA